MRGPDAKTTDRARRLRQVDNTAEGRLWLRLRNKQTGHKFSRQHPIGSYFADFASLELRLVIEVDGSQHIDAVRDETRNRFMVEAGWSVARFGYADVLNDLDTVLETLAAVMDGRISEPVVSREFHFFPAISPSPQPSPRRQGEGVKINPLSLAAGRGGREVPGEGQSIKDEHFMRRAIDLGRAQSGRTIPNPAVGCVIVRDGVILAEAATGDGGRPHAEEAALDTLGGKAEGATAYVTLEPCGERSGGGCSCSQRLVEAGVARVVFACEDPSPYASHIGTKRLKAADIMVETGLMQTEAYGLMAEFVKNLPVKR